MDTTTFAQKIKTKYPAYQNVDDATLVSKILEKYPEYKNVVKTDTAPSFTESVSSSISERGQNISDIQSARKQGQSVIGEVIQTVSPALAEKVNPTIAKIQELKSRLSPGGVDVATTGQAAGLVNDILGAGLAAITPDFVKQFGKDVVQAAVPEVLAKAGIQTMEDYNAWAQKNPMTAKNVEGVVNIASLLPVGAGAKGVTPVVSETVEGITKGIVKKGGNISNKAQSLKSSVIPTYEESILELVTPELSTKKVGQAIKSGRGKVSQGTIFDTVSITPDSKITKAAEAVKGIVEPKNTVTENINSVRKALSSEAESLKSKISDVKSIFTFKELNSALKNVDLPISFKEDAQAKVLEKVTEAAMKIAKGKKGKIDSLLDARKEFDRLVEENFPNLYEAGKPTPTYNAITKTRSALNDFIESKLPDGFGYKESLRKQSSLYDALDAMESKAAKEFGRPTNKIIRKAQDIAKKNPKATSIAKTLGTGIVGYGAIKGLTE